MVIAGIIILPGVKGCIMIIDDIMEYASHYDLLIFDINGVLDNNHNAKVEVLSAAFPQLSDLEISKVNVAMERAYEKSKSSSTASHIADALLDNGISIESAKAEELSAAYYDLNRVNPEIIEMLNSLAQTKKVCLYTSLSKAKVDYITSKGTLSDDVLVFSRDVQLESKPSIRNLEAILEQTGVSADRAVLFGDNVAVDIMPANLLGIKAVLVTNYVDSFIRL